MPATINLLTVIAPNCFGVVGPKRATQQSVLRNGLHTSAAQPGSGPRIGVPLPGGATGVGIIGPSYPDRAMRSRLRLRDWRSHAQGRSSVDNHAPLISNRDLDADGVVTKLAPPPRLGTRSLKARNLEWSRVLFDCGSLRL